MSKKAPGQTRRARKKIQPAEGNAPKSPDFQSNTSKMRMFSQELHAAIRRVEEKKGKRLVEHLVEMAYDDKQVLMVLAKKILPDLKHSENSGTVDHQINISWDGGGSAFAPNQVAAGQPGAAVQQGHADQGPLPAPEAAQEPCGVAPAQQGVNMPSIPPTLSPHSYSKSDVIAKLSGLQQRAEGLVLECEFEEVEPEQTADLEDD